jgi:transglutaminase-like putative cysteine protease
MNYSVRHRTTYRYSNRVAYSRLIAHLVPRTTERQHPRTFDVDVKPWPLARYQRSDFFGNTTNWFIIDEPHDELDVIAQSQVSVDPLPDPSREATPPWEAVRRSFDFPLETGAGEAVQYVFDTPLTTVTADVVTYAESIFRPGRPLFECALELNSRIHRDFTYDGEATDTRTTVERVFELRAGVCQDLAHAGIAAVRALGLAARYVSGYLLTQPAPGHERLIGADASHAWFSVWIPPLGWVDFDPTNDMLPSSEHITIGWGRDYGDVAPIHGIITGGSEHDVEVAVDVIPLAG